MELRPPSSPHLYNPLPPPLLQKERTSTPVRCAPNTITPTPPSERENCDPRQVCPQHYNPHPLLQKERTATPAKSAPNTITPTPPSERENCDPRQVCPHLYNPLTPPLLQKERTATPAKCAPNTAAAPRM